MIAATTITITPWLVMGVVVVGAPIAGLLWGFFGEFGRELYYELKPKRGSDEG